MIIEVVRVNLFIDRLITKMTEKDSRICVGLDPHIDQMPEYLMLEAGVREAKSQAEYLKSVANAIISFNRIIIENIKPFTAVIKPQLAFYEQLGLPGLKVFKKTVEFAKESGLMVIVDGKRNDIGSSAKGYYNAYLNKENDGKKLALGFVKADALTVNPYLGFEGIEPFLENEEAGVFGLLRTSNPGAEKVQNLMMASGKRFYEELALMFEEWGEDYCGEMGYSNLGAVIGATCPEELAKLRKLMPHTFFLIPGYGAQGGGADDVVAGFDINGCGGIVNSARSIIFAYRKKLYKDKYKEDEFGLASAEAAEKMQLDINQALKKAGVIDG